jgi:hypothetical protein
MSSSAFSMAATAWPIDAAACLHGHGPQMAIDELDIARILADHHRRQRLDDLGQAAAAEALVVFRPADDAVIGHDLEERERPPSGIAAQGFDLCDFHFVSRLSLLVAAPLRVTCHVSRPFQNGTEPFTVRRCINRRCGSL